jgi:MSHA pilin protein MshC
VRHAASRNAGFTTVELITVMVLLAIVSAIAVPRMMRIGDFNDPGFGDEAGATLRYARKLAVANRRAICVSIASDGITLTMDPRTPESYSSVACTTPATPIISIPGSHCAANKVCPPSSVALAATPSVFVYLPSGETSADVSVTAGTKTIAINKTTGYAP